MSLWDGNIGAESAPVQEHAMQLVLFEAEHSMRTIWLPVTKEGRYTFDARAGEEELPLAIVAADGCWYAVIGKGGSFLLDSYPPSRKVRLQDRFLVKVQYRDKLYALYAEEEFDNDNTFLPYYVEQHGEIYIGRSPECDIYYPNSLVSRRHAKLVWRFDHWEIVDTDSKNGVFLNGRNIRQAPVALGDVIYIMGMRIVMGAGYICINNANQRVQMTTPRVRPVRGEQDVAFAPCPQPAASGIFDRQPRRRYQLESKQIDIDSPPMPMNANKIPLMLRMSNPLVMGGRALMTGNVVTTLTSLVFPALTQGVTEKDRKEYEARRSVKYREYLEIKRKEILTEIQEEQRILNDVYPDVSGVLQFASNKKRLWERRKIDEDFLSVRLGSGQIPMAAQKHYTPKRFELERDELAEEMYSLVETPSMLERAPVLLSLREDFISSIVGGTQLTMTLVRNMIIQLSLTHAYDEVKLVVLAEPEDAAAIDFIRYLPHNWDNERSIRFFATSRSDAQQLSKYLNNAWAGLLNNGDGKSRRQPPVSYVVFAASKKLFDSVELLKEVLQQEEYAGISLVTAFEGAPKECRKMISFLDGSVVIDLRHPEVEEQTFVLDSCSQEAVDRSMRQLMQTKLRIDSQQYALPNMISFLEMYNVGMVEHLNPLKRWEDNNPVKSLAAPIGVGTDGNLFTLDLHEKRQGPHGLVAGMTGSGKSEFIITYILSMAVNFSPDEVAFILIDYKGGGLADAFVDEKRGIHLPHVVGTITNLDGASIQRSLMSIRSELMRRQEVFKRAKSETEEGTMDIYDYQKLYRNKRVSEPMPHLFIISDEFAELKKQQPEFMDELISTARIGRSLGVHLILATQKPGGVVNDQIWSNTKFRACLRVQDRTDSMEMLKRPEAAELKNTGRFYLQVGYNELFALGQSAWCGAGYIPQEEVLTEEDNSIQFVDMVGQTVLNAKPKAKTEQKAECKQIVAIVRYLSNLAKREGIMPRKLWADPLPQTLELQSLLDGRTGVPQEAAEAVIGMVDDPEQQRQFPLLLNLQSFHNMLLAGNSGSGKSTFLRTMLYSLVTVYPPEELNYYIFDLSGGALNAFRTLPHCGAYLTENNEADFSRLLDLLRELINERKRLFSEAQVSSFEAYRQTASLPLVLFIIDGFTSITSLQRGADYYGNIHEYMRDASGCGIRIILTCNHMNEVSAKAKQELDYRIALRAKDRFEYTDMLNAKCAIMPPECGGRGLCVLNGRTLEYQTAVLDSACGEQERALLLRDRLAQLAEKYAHSTPAKALPMADTEQAYDEFCAGMGEDVVPLGYSRKDMKKVDIPFQQLHSMSLYFGNAAGVRPVFRNLLYAARRSSMNAVIVRRQAESVFDPLDPRSPLAEYGGATVLDCTAEDLARLDQLLLDEIAARNVFRDQFCEEHGIPKTDKGRVRKASRYIRSRTTPLLVILESFSDFCRLEKDETLDAEFRVFFERTKGYNIYFAAGFYPEDSEAGLSAQPLMRSYNKDQLLLLFGGRYDKQCLTNLPMDLRRMDKPNPKYDRYLLQYRGEIYSMLMPCGALTVESDPDEAPII